MVHHKKTSAQGMKRECFILRNALDIKSAENFD